MIPLFLKIKKQRVMSFDISPLLCGVSYFSARYIQRQFDVKLIRVATNTKGHRQSIVYGPLIYFSISK